MLVYTPEHSQYPVLNSDKLPDLEYLERRKQYADAPATEKAYQQLYNKTYSYYL
jgi:hypothetical protein